MRYCLLIFIFLITELSITAKAAFRDIPFGMSCEDIISTEEAKLTYEQTDSDGQRALTYADATYRGNKSVVLYICGRYWTQVITYGVYTIDEALREATALSSEFNKSLVQGIRHGSNFTTPEENKALDKAKRESEKAYISTLRILNFWTWELEEFLLSVSIVPTMSVLSDEKQKYSIYIHTNNREYQLEKNPKRKACVERNWARLSGVLDTDINSKNNEDYIESINTLEDCSAIES